MRRGFTPHNLLIFLPAFRSYGRVWFGVLLFLAAAVPSVRAQGDGPFGVGETLDAVRDRGFVQCGVNTGLPGMAMVDTQGVWDGFDVAFCRAVAAAVLGDAEAVQFTPLNPQVRLDALAHGDVDLLARNTTWTLSRDAGRGLSFVGVNYYDGQAVLTHRSLGAERLSDLPAGTRVCVQSGTTTIQNLRNIIGTAGLDLEVMVFSSPEEARGRFFMGECQAYTGDRTGLTAVMAVEAPRPGDLMILSDTLSKEPLGPVVRENDTQWFDVVRWTLFAMIQAEEWGVGQANLAEVAAGATDPALRRFLGLDPGVGGPLGLDDAWVHRILAQVGNYAEVFERTLGRDGPIGIDRGLNRLWSDGGLLYAPPFQ